jgi:predicted metal-dependent phosphoesterase TrpH
MRVDLHIHSTASDGCWHPPQLVAQVRQAGIGLFAVADHDTVANVRPVEHLARDSGLAFIRAVEVSTTLDGHLFHFLGYGIDPEDPSLLRVLQENEETMESVDQQSIHKLIEAGYDLRPEEYDLYENDVTRGGWKALNLFICAFLSEFERSQSAFQE